jgi:hypothetical protein
MWTWEGVYFFDGVTIPLTTVSSPNLEKKSIVEIDS